MSVLAIVGFILAVLNPVIGGVLFGYLVWRTDPDTGFQIILLALTVFSLLVIGFIVWSQKKIKKLEKAVRILEGRSKIIGG
jgi:MFS family permease